MWGRPERTLFTSLKGGPGCQAGHPNTWQPYTLDRPGHLYRVSGSSPAPTAALSEASKYSQKSLHHPLASNTQPKTQAKQISLWRLEEASFLLAYFY